jgi:PmbA protein
MRSYESSGSSMSVSVIAGSDQGMETDYDYTSAVYFADLKTPEEIGRSAGQRAVRKLGGRKMASCRVPIIFDPRVARGLVSHFLGAINGASVARGTTFLKDAMDTEVFAPGLNVIEEPHRQRGLRSKPCDAEGLPNHKRALIDNGRLTSWILDLRSARQLNLTPTGHAARSTGGPPSPSTTNVFLAAGAETPEALMADITEGFYITDLVGQGVNMVTGDYSRGAVGFWIEKGKTAYPVSEVTIAGNLPQMFKAIRPANDLELLYGIDAPTVRIDGMTVAGT